jgi:uncharacterized damage-inducible protein DinB
LYTAVIQEVMNRSFDGLTTHLSVMDVTKGLTAAQAAWQPPGGLHSVWQQVAHLNWAKGLYAARLNGAPPVDDSQLTPEVEFPSGRPEDEEGWAALLASLKANHAALVARIGELAPDELDRTLPGGRTPLKVLIGVWAVHDSYHTGQIVSVRRLQGSWPPAGLEG